MNSVNPNNPKQKMDVSLPSLRESPAPSLSEPPMIRSDVKKGSTRRRVDFVDVTGSPRCVLSFEESYPPPPPPLPPPDDNDDSKEYYPKKADFSEEGGWSPSFLGEDDNRERDYEDDCNDGAITVPTIFRGYKLDDEARDYCYYPLTTTVPALPLWPEEEREVIPSLKRAGPVYDSESESEDWREDGEESSASAAPPPQEV